MTDTFHCAESSSLVGYLYDECKPAERAALEAHLLVCPACSAELSALGSTREQLASWTPPDAELGFVITRARISDVREAPSPTPAPAVMWWRRPMPLWAQAVAASAVFGAGLWLGVMQDGLVPGVRSEAARVAAPAEAGGAVSASDLAALEARLRSEIAGMRTQATGVSTEAARMSAAPESPNEAALLARVRALIDESEMRQRRELALRTAEVVRDFDSQRRVDLDQIQRTVGQIEGVTGAEVRQQRQMLNYLIQVSQQQPR